MMMLRKQPLQKEPMRKPTRFNLGGLIKKKIVWKRLIDQLALSIDTLLALETQPLPVHLDNMLHTECISLSNSDMLSSEEVPWHTHTDDLDVDDGFVPFDPKSEELATDYCLGGYFAVKLGAVFDSKKGSYRIVRKLGWGHFSTVWLAQALDGAFVAVKIVKSGKHYSEAARDEISILEQLQGAAVPVVQLLDLFDVSGPNGVHAAMVFELMGENVLHLIYRLKAGRTGPVRGTPVLPMEMAKRVIFQTLVALDAMHRLGVVHTDIKPENILMAHAGVPEVAVPRGRLHFQILPSQPLEPCLAPLALVKVADLGNATYTLHHFTAHIQTRQYRAPEILLRHRHWGAAADVWLVGCLVFELLTGDFLFHPHDGHHFDKDEDHVAQIVELLGTFPLPLFLARCELLLRYFALATTFKNIAALKFWLLADVLAEKYGFDMESDDMRLVADLMLKCLRYELAERYDCGSLLKHPWFDETPTFNAEQLELLPNNNCEVRGFTCEE